MVESNAARGEEEAEAVAAVVLGEQICVTDSINESMCQKNETTLHNGKTRWAEESSKGQEGDTRQRDIAYCSLLVLALEERLHTGENADVSKKEKGKPDSSYAVDTM
jgi:hypothetical protein